MRSSRNLGPGRTTSQLGASPMPSMNAVARATVEGGLNKRSMPPWWNWRLSGSAWVVETIHWTRSIYGLQRSLWLSRGWRGWCSIEGSGRRR